MMIPGMNTTSTSKSDAEKLLWHASISIVCTYWHNGKTSGRMLKKAVQQDRSEHRGEEVQTALRVGRSPFEWILANGKAPPVIPISERLSSAS
jgi:hypothetical protein